MQHRTFKLSHSLAGTIALLILEGIALGTFGASSAGVWLIAAIAAIGAGANIYAATEVIEEVKSARHMLVFLSVLVAVFVAFFAFQYWFLLLIQPASFPTLASDPLSLLLHSIMVLVFNPIYLPATGGGEALLTVNTLSAMVLVLFILQNIWQFRRKSSGLAF